MLTKIDPIELMLARSQHKQVANINKDVRAKWLQCLAPTVRDTLRELVNDYSWQIFTVNQSRGRCYYNTRIITIPAWAMDKEQTNPGYVTWYTAHEMSHCYEPKDGHGDRFMGKLIEICPENCIHYELGYKPRNAARNGIGQINLADI